MSRRRVACEAWHPIEVGVSTGQFGKAVRLHHRHEQSVIAEEPGLAAEHRSGRDQRNWDRHDPDAALQDPFNGIVKARKLLHLGGMLPKPPGDASQGP